MRLRKLSQRPGPGYRRAVQSFASFLGRSPDTAALEDLRRFQLYLVDRGISPVSFNNAMNTGGAEPR